MASWESPGGPSRRDSSPTSPLTPLSPSGLPEWLRPSRSRRNLLSNSKAKVILLAAFCLALGWLFTASLGPIEEELELEDHNYSLGSAGVLSDPSGFGAHAEQKKRPGIIENEEDEGSKTNGKGFSGNSKDPSVSGALSELRHAVSNKIQSWNPYFVKPAHQEADTLTTAVTSGKESGKNTTKLLAGESVKDGISEEDGLGARIRIGKATVLFHGNPFWERCIRTHELHDKEHGYRLHVLRQQLMDDVWSKPSYILSLILRELSKPESERLDWLFWVDADTVILNPYVPIETFLPPPGTEFDNVHLVYSNDWNGLNNGVFPMRVNQWTAQLFSAIVAYRHYKPEDPLQFRDQSAMNSLMQEPAFAKHIVQVPQRWFNAYQGEHNETLQPFQVRRGDLLVHFAGVPAREERMQYWLERAEQHLDDWEVPVKSTSYPQEARDFWNGQRELRRANRARLGETRDKATKLLSTTDQQLNDYGDRLNDEQKSKISSQQEEVKKILEQENTKEDAAKIEEAMTRLSEYIAPLTTALADANKVLLQSAHEAIFAGEKDLLEGGFSLGSSNPEMEQISTTIKNLKALVMAPEEFWNRKDLTTATNAVTEARGKLQEKAAAEIAAQKQAQEEEAKANAVLSEYANVAAEAALHDSIITEVDVSSSSSGVAQDFVIVTVPGPTQWITTVFTATSTDMASPTLQAV